MKLKHKREIKTGEHVRVYRNLQNSKISVQAKGKVIAHVDNITLTDCKFTVNETARQRVIKNKKKEVHAFVSGNVKSVNITEIFNDYRASVTYNPYKYATFVEKYNDEIKVLTAEKALVLSTGSVYILKEKRERKSNMYKITSQRMSELVEEAAAPSS